MSATGPRPLIGVTTYRQTTSWWSWERDAALVPGPYLDTLEAAGGDAVLIPSAAAAAAAVPGPAHRRVERGGDHDRLLAALDGLLLIGGGDIEAARYGREPHAGNVGTNGHRDDLEIGLLEAALARDLPVLAVCRGLQLLNVARGGDLVQSLPEAIGSTAHQPRPGAFGQITVRAEPGSTVHRLLGDEISVLCSHHQAIGALGRDLIVTAQSADGVIEALELPGHRFVVGVQWHPEEVGDSRLFAGLVDAARDSRSSAWPSGASA